MIFPGGTCGAIGTVKIKALCSTNCAGYHYEFKNITWINSNKKMISEWENQVCTKELSISMTSFRTQRVIFSMERRRSKSNFVKGK